MKDEKLFIQKAKEGDEKAFGTLYDEYMPRIYRYVFVKVGARKQDAEDLTHQIFLDAWKSMHHYEHQGFPFSSWLYRIATNAVIDYYRTWKQHENIELVSEERLPLLPHDDTLDHNLTMGMVLEAIHTLEADQQNVLLMKFVDDLSNKEIAHAIGKSEGAVRVIQHRALKQLKTKLPQYDEPTSHSSTTQA